MSLQGNKALFKIDTHLHGYFSSDSKLDYAELCRKAILTNYKVLAFTEHIDLLDTELLNYGLLPLKQYYDFMTNLQSQFPELVIIKGVELGEPHRVGDFSKRLFKESTPDYIVGALHVTKTNINVSLPLREPFTNDDMKDYYEENLEMVEIGNFDTLAHLGIYKRGLLYQSALEENNVAHIIDEILRVIIKKNICLEVNSSSFKRNMNDPIPCRKILQRYKEIGGELLTICSDAHDLDMFNMYYQKTIEMIIECGFSTLYWKNKYGWEGICISD
jgi:histidinol-phosphatase (PHP family)